MSEQVLTILKFCLLALVYLFLARVVWVVAGEMRGTPTVAVAPPPAPAPVRPRKKQHWRIVIRQPAAAAGTECWVEGDVTIGRGAGCSLVIPGDTFVSQVHARVYERDGQLWVEDLGSTNGTLVNNLSLGEPARLRKGDNFQIGETLFEVDA
ncbi:MAG: FHA domain-containing protein [Actinomycetota bacterium]|nr:FHA domain-containing protein [Actinomycetota bacterium]